MKKIRKIYLSIILIFALSIPAFAHVLGDLISSYDTFLGAGMEMSQGIYWTGSDKRTENYIEYSPSSKIVPLVVSGSKLLNYGSFSSMAKLLENQGYHVIAGINGDYFHMSNFEPLGIVVENGILLSSDGGHYAVGFNSDGTSVFGKPEMKLSLNVSGSNFDIQGFNKTRNDYGVSLFTDFYSSKTQTTGPEGMNFLCTIDGDISLSSTVKVTFHELLEEKESVVIPSGKAILSVANNANEELRTKLLSLEAGDTFEFSVSVNQEFKNVSYAIGSLYKLITNGKMEVGLDNSLGPRTAVGKKADGSLVFYTIDGRQSGYSIGASMTQVAQRMLELGCVEASIMDGGGSTSLNAIYIGNQSLSQINEPSSGYQRSVTNYIMLATKEKATGFPKRLAVYPLTTNILSGSTTNFEIKAADENGYSADVPNTASLMVNGPYGTINSDGLFTATNAGEASIVANGANLIEGYASVNVVSSPDTINVFYQGTSNKVTSLELVYGENVSLMANAMDNYMYLISQDTAYTWSTEGNIGTIDKEGTFTAANENATGNIIISAGETKISIPVSIKSPEPFDDLNSSAWYYDAVKYVHENALMNGTAERIFSPDQNASRAMVVQILYRLAGEPNINISVNPFSDVEENQWYYKACLWGYENEIIKGDGGMFRPNDNISREELATILYRYMGEEVDNSNLESFVDYNTISTWALDGLKWATSKGIISGFGDGSIMPRNQATRAQLATIFMRLGA